ncbi:MAG: hypothetical protein ABEJ27_06920 [Halodesulfurarchaeum sp.]
MRGVWPVVRRQVLDVRVWVLTGVLLALYAANWHQLLPPPIDVLSAPSLSVMFLYLYLTRLGVLFKWVAGMAGFWVGYGLFTFAVSGLLWWGYDRYLPDEEVREGSG